METRDELLNRSTVGNTRPSSMIAYNIRDTVNIIQDEKESTRDDKNLLENSNFELVQYAETGKSLFIDWVRPYYKIEDLLLGSHPSYTLCYIGKLIYILSGSSYCKPYLM